MRLEEGVVFLAVCAAIILITVPIAVLVLVAMVLRRQDRLLSQMQRWQSRQECDLAGVRELLERGPTAAPGPMTEGHKDPSEARPASPPSPKPESVPEPPATVPPPLPVTQSEPAAVAAAESVPAPPATPTAPPREPSSFERAARDILRRAWNWFVVGEEYRPQGVSMEYAIVTHWSLRVGLLIVVFGVGFFLQYSISHGWISPRGRVSLSILAGVGMLAAGLRLLGRKYHLFGQGLIGGGIAILYLSVFAAWDFYGLIGASVAFVLMALITVGAGGMAMRLDSMLPAVLATLGGFGAPLMLFRGGEPNLVGHFSYMLLLGLGVLAIAMRRNWYVLNYLAFACTYGLFFVTLANSYQPDEFWQTMPFLIAFFVLYSTLIFVYNVLHGTKSTIIELLALFVNAGLVFGIGYSMIEDVYAHRWTAALSLGLAAFYTAHVYYFLRRQHTDRPLLLSFLGLASFFLTVTMPLLLSSDWITVSWAVQALVMLWIAAKLDSRFLRHIAYLIYALVLWRYCALDLPRAYARSLPADMAVFDYLRLLLERLVVFGVPVASFAGAFRLLQQPGTVAAVTVDRTNDIRDWVRDRWAVPGLGLLALSLLFVYLNLELNRSFLFFYQPLRLPALTLLWLAACVLLLAAYRWTPSRAILVFLIAFAGVVLLKLIWWDLASWHLAVPLMRYRHMGYSFLDAGFRFLDFGSVIACFAFIFMALAPAPATRRIGVGLGITALGLLFVYTTLELNSCLHHFVPGLRSGGISILWSVFALSLVGGGIWKDSRALRFAGLGLFAVVVWKIFFVDLQRLEQVYRILAFVVLGVIILSCSFVYLKYRHRFATDAGSQADVAHERQE